MPTRVLIAGIVRGSHRGIRAYSQRYRKEIKDLLERHLPGVEVFTPIESVRDTLDYGFVKGCEVFFDVVRRAASYDAVVAYIPEASMGAAIQMWEAYRNRRVVVAISPLKENHAVKALSTHLCADLRTFRKFVESGKFAELLKASQRAAAPSSSS